MQDAFGGILNMVFIAVFLILVEGILGFIVIYTKAFKMKNAVITTVEQYEARGCGLKSNEKDGACIKKIKESAANFGYNPADDMTCPSGYEKNSTGLFCYTERVNSTSDKKVYGILTRVDVPIPILNNIGFSLFQVTGDTRGIEKY